MEEKVLSPPSESIGVDSLAQSSRKRKLTACSTSENSKNLGVSQQCVNPDGFVDLNGKARNLESCNTSSPGVNSISTVRSPSLGASECIKENQKSAIELENGIEFSCGPLSIGLGDSVEEKDEGQGDGNIPVSKKLERSDIGNSKTALVQETLPKYGDSSANIVLGHVQEYDQCHGSLQSDEKRKLLAAKASSPVFEKLWDGSLQLSSSVTVSAVAFFKRSIPNFLKPQFLMYLNEC